MSYNGHLAEHCNNCGEYLGRRFVKHNDQSYCTIRCRDEFIVFFVDDSIDLYRGVHVSDPQTEGRER